MTTISCQPALTANLRTECSPPQPPPLPSPRLKAAAHCNGGPDPFGRQRCCRPGAPPTFQVQSALICCEGMTDRDYKSAWPLPADANAAHVFSLQRSRVGDRGTVDTAIARPYGKPTNRTSGPYRVANCRVQGVAFAQAHRRRLPGNGR